MGARLGAPDAVVRCFVPPPDDFEPAQTLGQAWDGLRWWLSAARDDGLNLAVVGGPEVGVDDAVGWGFGRPTMLDASQLSRVAEALRTVKVTPDEHATPTDVYLASEWTTAQGRETLTRLTQQLTADFAGLADRPMGLLR